MLAAIRFSSYVLKIYSDGESQQITESKLYSQSLKSLKALHALVRWMMATSVSGKNITPQTLKNELIYLINRHYENLLFSAVSNFAFT